MQNITGSPVEGNNFYGRESEIGTLERSIRDHKDILLLSPRRTGKSSISLEIMRRLRDQGWAVSRCNLEKAGTEVHLVEEFESGLGNLDLPGGLRRSLRRAVAAFRRLAAGVRIGSIEIPTADRLPEWRDAIKEVEAALKKLASSGKPVLFVVDELPIFIASLLRAGDGGERARAVLNWLRFAQGLKREGFVWFLCGSIGLDSQVEHLGIPGVISDFEIHDLGPMGEGEAKGMLWELSKSSANPIAMTREVAERILEKTGWAIPCYLQLLYHALSELPPGARTPDYPAPADVDAAYEHLMSAHFTSKFAPWDARLDEPFIDPIDARRARFLLGRICAHPGGLDREHLIQERLAREPNADPDDYRRGMRRTVLMLERDGYLMQSGELIAFRSPVLRDYWFRHHA